MRKLALLAAGSLLGFGALSASAPAAPLSQTAAVGEDLQAPLIEQVRHGWGRGRHYGWRRGHHYGWYGHRGWRRYGYDRPYYYGRPYGYYRPYRPRVGVYFGFGGPGYW